MKRQIRCPHCNRGFEIAGYSAVTVDILIELDGKIVLIKRKNPPFGWAIPGGFIDYGESAEAAAVREALEETGLKLSNLRQFRVYSDPDRDSRMHTISAVFIADGLGIPIAADDAQEVGVFTEEELPSNLAFDHRKILRDYYKFKSR